MRWGVNSTWIFVMLLFSIVLMYGCGGTYKSSELQREVIEETESVIYKNISLKASVAVLEHELVDVGPVMKVRLRVKNMISRTVNAEIKIKWLDSSGFEISDDGGWFPFTLASGEIKSYERFAPNNRVADYKILIQLGKN